VLGHRLPSCSHVDYVFVCFTFLVSCYAARTEMEEVCIASTQAPGPWPSREYCEVDERSCGFGSLPGPCIATLSGGTAQRLRQIFAVTALEQHLHSFGRTQESTNLHSLEHLQTHEPSAGPSTPTEQKRPGMSATLRQRGVSVARRTRTSRISSTRTYASEHHGAASEHAAPKNEALGVSQATMVIDRWRSSQRH
jgi:hypothetical protein